MKWLLASAVFFLSSCGVESVTEDIKTMQAYKIYMVGEYTAVNTNCSQAFLVLSTSQINDSEIVCDLKRVESAENGFVILKGENCSAEGHKLPDFSFSVKHNDDETITYKNSGETVWQTLKQCPLEIKAE